ncbi:uncharacterized protein DC041_0009030, partial [Schistosoma bovis]
MNLRWILGFNKYSIVESNLNNRTSFSYYYYYHYYNYNYNIYQYWIIRLFILNFMILCNISNCGLAQPWFSLEAVKEYLDIASISLTHNNGIHSFKCIKCINPHELIDEIQQYIQGIQSSTVSFKHNYKLHINDDDNNNNDKLKIINQIPNKKNNQAFIFDTKQAMKYSYLKHKKPHMTNVKRLHKMYKRFKKRTLLKSPHYSTTYEYVPFIKSKLIINILYIVTINMFYK